MGRLWKFGFVLYSHTYAT